MTRVLGAVLAGGRARRFGSDKALARLGDATLIEHVIAGLRPQVDALLVCGRVHATLPWVADRPAPDLGPLGGLAAALRHAADSGFDAVLSVPCDAPALPGDLRAAIAACGAPCFLATLPVIGLWPASLADRLDAFVATDPRRSVRGWGAAAGARACLPDLHIANVNAPADLAALAAADRA